MVYRSWLGCLPVVVLVAGCGDDSERSLAEASITSALETTRSGGTLQVVTDATDTHLCADPSAVAALAASLPTRALYPAECVTKTAEGPTVHVQLDQCTGVFGRRVLDGGFDATFEGCAGGAARATLADSGDLTANGRPVRWNARAEISEGEGAQLVDWDGHWSATTRRGRHVEQDSSLGVTIDDATECVSVAGAAHGHVDWRDFDKSISDLVVCPDECPRSGQLSVNVEGRLRDRSMTIRFDGSSTAKVVGFRGDEFDVELACDD